MGGSETRSARLLDLSRLVSRVGRDGAWTGIDRVEAAYLDRLLKDTDPLFGLVRLPGGFFLLDRAGVAALADRLTSGVPWGAVDLRARLHFKANAMAQAARADLGRLSMARSGARGIGQMLAGHVPPGFHWLNVGHSNLSAEMFDAVRGAGGRAGALVHDTIPLDFPDYQRPGTVERFAERMRAVSAGANLVICPSEATRGDAARHFENYGHVPDMLVAPLGVPVPVPDPGALPDDIDRARPYFVVLGTIEPRKNHALLLDVWAQFAATLPETEMPALHIVGTRGWANAAVFDRLDRGPLIGRHVFEHGALNDGAVAALVAGAQALLMPSLAEGFGLPPAEALALGRPVIATDLPVYREALGNNPVYLNGRDLYSWANEILDFARGQARTQTAAPGKTPALPTWQDHFDLVLKAL